MLFVIVVLGKKNRVGKMLKTKFKPLDREQFALLRESKRLIEAEFGEQISLQDKDILDQIYAYALDSSTDRLYEIFNKMYASIDDQGGTGDSNDKVVEGKFKKAREMQVKAASANKVKIGDIVDGQECISIYRGQPVFK